MQIYQNLLNANNGISHRCPYCDEPITTTSINIQEGFALCPQCGKLMRLSELIQSSLSTTEIISKPPEGCSIISDGRRLIATVSTRSISGFIISAAISLFWNGIVSVFVLVALAGLYANLIGPLPNWFPAPVNKNGLVEMNEEPMSLGLTLFLCVFLIPFVAIGTFLIGTALMYLFGKVQVVVDELVGYVETGVLFFRWKKRFTPHEVQKICFSSSTMQSEGESNRVIEIKADKTVKFGSLLPSDRQDWLRALLFESLLKSTGRAEFSRKQL